MLSARAACLFHAVFGGCWRTGVQLELYVLSVSGVSEKNPRHDLYFATQHEPVAHEQVSRRSRQCVRVTAGELLLISGEEPSLIAMAPGAMTRIAGMRALTAPSSTLARSLQRSCAARREMSRWSKVPLGPEDAILGVTVAYNHDPNPKKINLGVGAYRDDEGKPFVLESVRMAERILLEAENAMEYLPVAGDKTFVKNALKLAFGSECSAAPGFENFAGMQTLSGTGACRMGGELLARFYDAPDVYLPTPSWANHTPIFKDAGCTVKGYTYYDASTCGLDFKGMVADIEKMPPSSVVLLHACAHNPTGVDPSKAQWDQLSALMREKHLVPFFDMAYQGFTSGDADVDAYAPRKFLKDGHHMILAQSFSKNFGLYGHRVGCLSFACDSVAEAQAVESQLKILARPMYSNPPIHGVRVVNEILQEKTLESKWRLEMQGMAERITGMRMKLRSGLEARGSAKIWDHITSQNGMFCYSGLTPEQVGRLSTEWSVYLTKNGRISMAGVTSRSVEYLADAIHAVTK
ncbi:Aspartate aminotransferase, mitochondrial [Porphyridium purpureum]|uniref:Aspartate aminotransferase n=1 Tax=Porphyridium purpureum TaxID=35688 RepID=A0A5J4YWL5_PORPP|nr:Aspartate aminotransferase, mitochondrial [Porphyridium purpureum]|eukprot:POR0761..scf209_3